MVYGSSGARLDVTPQPERSVDIFNPARKVRGPAVVATRIDGETSGRFDVAGIAGALFPSAKPFVDEVIAMDPVPQSQFQYRLSPTDKITRLPGNVVQFTTPAGRDGLGTTSRLEAGDQPIEGLVMWLPDQENDLLHVDVRLRSRDDLLVQAITSQFAASQAKPTPN